MPLTKQLLLEERAKTDALEARVAELEAAIRWALGEVGEFSPMPEPEPGKLKRPYWWRKELRRRANLT